MLRVMIVHGEPAARDRLRTLLAACREPAARVVAEAAGAGAAWHRLCAGAVDAVLLAVAAPLEAAVGLARGLQTLEAAPALVVVGGAEAQAALAFDLDAADFLLPPFGRPRLEEALRRAARRVPLPAAAPAAPGSLVVRDRGGVLRVPLADILYLRASQKYVTLRTAAHAYLLDDPLCDLERRLGAHAVRIHRNALVACGAIARLERRGAAARSGDGDGDAGGAWQVQVRATRHWLPVARRRVAGVRQALLDAPPARGPGSPGEAPGRPEPA